MKIVFFGTPDFVLPIVEALHKEFNHGREREFETIVTQAPKNTGRDHKLTYSAVDDWAFKHKFEIIRNIADVPFADLGIVAAYGNIIPKSIIEKFSNGIINIHPSLLPEFRGASPIQAALASGKIQTGITFIKMDEQMDHGPIISQVKEEILESDNNETLRTRLFESAAEVLIELIPNYLNGRIKLKEQDHDIATFTKLIKKEDGFVDLDFIKSALNGDETESAKILNLFRAYTPWPGVWTKIVTKDEKEKILKLTKINMNDGQLIIDEVQIEGKNPVNFRQFKEGHPGII